MRAVMALCPLLLPRETKDELRRTESARLWPLRSASSLLRPDGSLQRVGGGDDDDDGGRRSSASTRSGTARATAERTTPLLPAGS